MGRPSEYTEQAANKICEKIAEGLSIRTICKEEDMPAPSTIFKWLSEHRTFSEQYARAKEAQADAFAEEILDIADDSRNDWIEIHGEDGEVERARENGEAIRRSVLRVDARKWLMGKMKPKKYGDAALIKLGGDPDGVPIQASVAVTFVRTNATSTDEG